MGTTIDDIYYEEYLLDQAHETFENEVKSRIESIKQGEIVDTVAWEIFNFLPVHKTQISEEDYISHLWSSFIHLNAGSEESRQFSIMPMHLLFMLSLQYKVLRIHRQLKEKYDNAFTMENLRDNEKDLLNPSSVFTIGFLSESKLVDLFKLVGITPELAKRIKSLIKYRNDNLAHAKGGIALDIEEKIAEYIKCLDKLQENFNNINDAVAVVWLGEMGVGQEGVEYIDTHLAGEYLCPIDMQAGKISKLDSRLNSR